MLLVLSIPYNFGKSRLSEVIKIQIKNIVIKEIKPINGLQAKMFTVRSCDLILFVGCFSSNYGRLYLKMLVV